MNILQVLPALNLGGVETGTLDIARQLTKLGHKVVVVSSGGELVKDVKECGAIHYELAVDKKSIFSIWKSIVPLVDIIKKEKIDVVHARSRVPAWIAYFACRRTNVAFVTTCHGYYTKHLFSYVMGWAKYVITISNVIARHMIDDFGVPHERIRLVPRSVDIDKFKFLSPDKKRREEFNVGIIGRITPIKGHLYFIKAMAKASRSIPKLKIWIVGDASATHQAYKEQVQVLVRRLGLWHCTEFLGVQRDIPEVLSHLDLLVLATTTHEAFGRVIIEAQASGVPVVATSVGGVVDIIEERKTGLLVPPTDTTSMASAIVEIFKKPDLAAELASNAYKKVKDQYNLDLMVKNTLNIYKEALSNSKILIIKFSSLGDIIISTAALRAIRQKFGPNYKISFMVSEESKDVLMRCPYIDELLVVDFKGRDEGIKGLLNLGRILRKKNFDFVVDLQNNRKSHILSFLSLSQKRYGYDNKKLGFLLNRRIKDDKPLMDPVAHQFRILKMLGIDLLDPHLELWPSRQDEEYVEDFINSEWMSPNQKIIGINISASPRWLTKSWPIENITKLCEELGYRDFRIIITGTQENIELANYLRNSIKNTKIINACGKTTVNQLACLIKKCSVYVSADSSPLHIAAAMNVAFVALFGPTDPRRHLPLADKYMLMQKGLLCSPCYKTKCQSKKCMKQITPHEVLEAIEKLVR